MEQYRCSSASLRPTTTGGVPRETNRDVWVETNVVKVLHDDADQAFMKTGEDSSLASNTASWWSTPRDYPAFHEGFMKTGEVINPRCSENRGSAAQHF